ncbi:hypothetical protein L596_023413 [Steinernema carpocapsae]|uniref:Uncharacterized protein n=1 Tax=Steinernema carpocapsae TaxID=34508 RepID=A0A4U5MDL7_STECR|nr:hypothetical protein L596_023413 [Steinernema carpocapsae]
MIITHCSSLSEIRSSCDLSCKNCLFWHFISSAYFRAVRRISYISNLTYNFEYELCFGQLSVTCYPSPISPVNLQK